MWLFDVDDVFGEVDDKSIFWITVSLKALEEVNNCTLSHIVFRELLQSLLVV